MSTKPSKPMLSLKSGLKAGADPRGYCLQGCVTQVNQCSIADGENCDTLFTSCLDQCTRVNQPDLML